VRGWGGRLAPRSAVWVGGGACRQCQCAACRSRAAPGDTGGLNQFALRVEASEEVDYSLSQPFYSGSGCGWGCVAVAVVGLLVVVGVCVCMFVGLR